MVTARINTPGVIGKVAVRPNIRTTVTDPKFKPKPNVGLVELYDTAVFTPAEGDVITYVASTGKYENKQIGNVAFNITNINGGAF